MEKLRFRALDSWRGICALIVALYHFEPLGRIYSGHLRSIPLIGNGWLCVDFFFALSGFVIYHAYSSKLTDRKSVTNFIIRRFGRLWPLHAAVLLLLVATEFAKLYGANRGAILESAPFSEVYSVHSIFTNFALIQALGTETILTWNIPSWSISVEFCTYLIFALSFCSLKWRGPAIPLLFAIASGIVLFAFSNMEATTGFPLFRCLFGFYIGVAARIIFSTADARLFDGKTGATCLEILAILGASVAIVAARTNISFLAPFIFGFVIIVFAREKGAVSNVLTTRAFTFIGDRSYSIYLLHFALLLTLTRFIKTIAGGYAHSGAIQYVPLEHSNAKLVFLGSNILADGIVLLFVVLLLFASSITYKLIENPGCRIFNRWANELTGRAFSGKPAQMEVTGTTVQTAAG